MAGAWAGWGKEGESRNPPSEVEQVLEAPGLQLLPISTMVNSTMLAVRGCKVAHKKSPKTSTNKEKKLLKAAIRKTPRDVIGSPYLGPHNSAFFRGPGGARYRPSSAPAPGGRRDAQLAWRCRHQGAAGLKSGNLSWGLRALCCAQAAWAIHARLLQGFQAALQHLVWSHRACVWPKSSGRSHILVKTKQL